MSDFDDGYRLAMDALLRAMDELANIDAQIAAIRARSASARGEINDLRQREALDRRK